MLTRLFPAFPTGLSGMALLLFRAVLSITLLFEARTCLSASPRTPAAGLVALAALVSGSLLLVGLLTPIAGCLGCVFVALSGGTASTLIVFDSGQAVVFATTILVGIIVLGPGAYSLDARFFGRREIIIPPPVHSSRP